MDVKGKKVKLSIWVRSLVKHVYTALRTNLDSYPGYRGARTLPNHHLIILSWSSRNYFRSVTLLQLSGQVVHFTFGNAVQCTTWPIASRLKRYHGGTASSRHTSPVR